MPWGSPFGPCSEEIKRSTALDAGSRRFHSSLGMAARSATPRDLPSGLQISAGCGRRMRRIPLRPDDGQRFESHAPLVVRDQISQAQLLDLVAEGAARFPKSPRRSRHVSADLEEYRSDLLILALRVEFAIWGG